MNQNEFQNEFWNFAMNPQIFTMIIFSIQIEIKNKSVVLPIQASHNVFIKLTLTVHSCVYLAICESPQCLS